MYICFMEVRASERTQRENSAENHHYNRENVMYVIQNTIVKLVYECSCRPLILCSYPDL